MAFKIKAQCKVFAWLLAVYISGTAFAVHAAYAAEAALNIGATIIQCGPRTNLAKACEEREICCAFLDTFQMADTLHTATVPGQ